MAAFMATGHAKFTGEVGCCLATSGGGAIHLLNGLYDAKLDRQPVLAIVGQQKRVSLGARYQQEVDLVSLYKDVSEFVQVCMEPARARMLVDRLPEQCVLTCDTGSITNWWARHLKLRDGMDASLAGTLATMGPGTPYAIAAKLAHSDRPVIAFVGDGAFQMNGMAEMITVKRYLDRLTGSPLIFCVSNNQDLNQVTWEQRAMAGDPKFSASQDIPDVPYAEYAKLLGLEGVYCDDQNDVTSAWDQALASDRPVVLEFKVDSEVPPIPPHIKTGQAKKAAKAIAKGDPEGTRVVNAGLRQKLAEFYEKLPGRK